MAKKFTYICASGGRIYWSGGESAEHLIKQRFNEKEDAEELKAVKRFCEKAQPGWTHLTKDEFSMLVCTEA